MIGERLEHAGYGVVKARDGADALAYLHRAAPPSLILLDLAMPVMDGWEFLAERERDPALQSIPVVVLSGQRDIADRLATSHIGCISKPVTEDRLIRAVARALH